MKKTTIISALTCVGILSACASAPNSLQKKEMEVYRQKNLLVEEKSPGLGVGLGFLPGGGSFYSREYGYGVVNLLLWPISILWDPISGSNGAQSLNYTATKLHVNQLKQNELDNLDEELKLSKIDIKEYTIQKNKIDRKYSGSI